MGARPLHEVLTESDHPDPEGHLTDLTISKLRDLRDGLRVAGERATNETTPEECYRLGVILGVIDRILEPWGESTD